MDIYFVGFTLNGSWRVEYRVKIEEFKSFKKEKKDYLWMNNSYIDIGDFISNSDGKIVE